MVPSHKRLQLDEHCPCMEGGVIAELSYCQEM